MDPGYASQRLTRTWSPGAYFTSVNGPVPSAVCVPNDLGSLLRASMLQNIEFSVANVSGKAANGVFILTTTVLPEPTSIVSIDAQNTAFCPSLVSANAL